jgi:hypothetical protein
VDVGVISQVIRIMSAMRRIKRYQHERCGGRLFERDSVVVYLGRQLTVGQLLARLRQNQIRVGINLEIEIHDQCCLLVCRRI